MNLLEDLPIEILLEILSYVSVDDLHQNVALVSKTALWLSRTPNPLTCLRLRIDESGQANFNADTLALHTGTKKLDIKVDCFCEGGRICAAHTVVKEALGSFQSLKSVKIYGKCQLSPSFLFHWSQQQKANVQRLDLGFSIRGINLGNFTGLQEIMIDWLCGARMVLRDLLLQHGPRLTKICIKTKPPKERRQDPYRIPKPKPWPLLTTCINLKSLHLSVTSSQCWNAIAGLTTLTSLGLTFDYTFFLGGNLYPYNDDWEQMIQPLQSVNLEELELHGFGNDVLGTPAIWNAIPSHQIKRVRITFAKTGTFHRTASIKETIEKVAQEFQNLEELVWDPIEPESPVQLDFHLLALNPPHFPNLKKLSLPYNCEEPIYKYCHNLTELEFTWNDQVTMEHFVSTGGGIMTDVVTFCGNNLKRLVLEINAPMNLRIPDLLRMRMLRDCPNATIVIKPL